jgi:DNA-binding transcriptional regulator YiaG
MGDRPVGPQHRRGPKLGHRRRSTGTAVVPGAVVDDLDAREYERQVKADAHIRDLRSASEAGNWAKFSEYLDAKIKEDKRREDYERQRAARKVRVTSTTDPSSEGATRLPVGVGRVDRLQNGDQLMPHDAFINVVSGALLAVASSRATLVLDQRSLLGTISYVITEILSTDFRKIRIALDFNQSELSRLTGISTTTLAQWERRQAEPSLALLRIYCERLRGERLDALNRLAVLVQELDSAPITQLREALSLSQATFARIAGITQITLIDWEAGKNHPRLRSLLALINQLEEHLASTTSVLNS